MKEYNLKDNTVGANLPVQYGTLGKIKNFFRLELTPKEQKVLTEYIRHQIHHPENHLNTKYTRIELQQSIEEMRQFISDMEAEQLTEEP